MPKRGMPRREGDCRAILGSAGLTGFEATFRLLSTFTLAADFGR